jgi:hypothetical protein
MTNVTNVVKYLLILRSAKINKNSEKRPFLTERPFYYKIITITTLFHTHSVCCSINS